MPRTQMHLDLVQNREGTRIGGVVHKKLMLILRKCTRNASTYLAVPCLYRHNHLFLASPDHTRISFALS